MLWTESRTGLLIWYIVKHKAVPRHLKLIEEAEKRSSRQLTPASMVVHEANGNGESAELSSDFIMLDPKGHTPLKLYNVPSQDLSKLLNSKWEPLLHLTKAERDIVETVGTVLVLGRSGTGKTVCICNRMDYDRHMAQNVACFRQLFVSRSELLCRYVEGTVKRSSDGAEEESTNVQFATYGALIGMLEKATPDTAASFARGRRVGYQQFKQSVWDSSMQIDALVAWTSFHSLIKGSIEAVNVDNPVDKESYLGLGKKRCRLSESHREAVYSAYEKYDAYCRERSLWDDCDRIMALLRALAKLERVDPHTFDALCYDKIYCDEVQDLTQAEIVLFFRLSGPGNLFFCW